MVSYYRGKTATLFFILSASDMFTIQGDVKFIPTKKKLLDSFAAATDVLDKCTVLVN